jgi:thiol-disulfide isomerase/thioredoxin
MPVVVSLVVLVGAICVLDLVLTLGVIRRLREHTELIAKMGQGGVGIPEPMLGAGETAGDFEAVATTGEVIARDGLAGQTLLGVFSPGCSACVERLPGFVELAREWEGGRDQVLAVVVDMAGEGAEQYVGKLEPVARVVVETRRGGVNAALKVQAFPAIGVLADGGRVLTNKLEADLAAPAVL